ncbi:tetratricopeptide repeat protein [Frateuria aurantia]
MKLAFYLIAAIMIVATALLLVIPLWRRNAASGQGSSRPLAVALAVLVPVAAVIIYLCVGQPSTLNGVPRQDPAQQQLADALTKLENHLKEQPKDTQGWLLLGQTMAAIRQPQAALDAYQHALDNAPDNVMAMVGWAEMSAMTRPDHQLDDHARDLLQHAVTADPKNQRALWLLGISEYQHGHFAAAIARWKALQPLLDPNSEIGKIVVGQIQDAQKQLQGPATAGSAAAAPAAAGPATATSSGAHVAVTVRLDPSLAARLKPGDSLFVYARAPSGPPMPLAATRLPASALPASITLTDAMAMLPQQNLSSARHIIVGARISHSGQPMPAAGDLEGESLPIDLPTDQPVQIVINKVD